MGRTANGRDEAPSETVEFHSDRVNSRSSTCISEHIAAEDIHNQPTLPGIARKDILHSDRAEGPFLSSRRKRPRAEAFSEAEPTTSVRTQSKSPRLAESNSCSGTLDGTPMVADVKVEDFEGHGYVSFRMRCVMMIGVSCVIYLRVLYSYTSLFRLVYFKMHNPASSSSSNMLFISSFLKYSLFLFFKFIILVMIFTGTRLHINRLYAL